MGPKVKKPPKNAFSFFLDDYVESEREKGRHVSHRIAAEECGPLWKELPQEEKDRYGKLAAVHKQYSKDDKRNKFTTLGISYAQLEREQDELRMKIEKADTEIKVTVSNLDSELLKTHLFYIVHCNYYCKTDTGMYVPGEIAIVEFNLQDGIRRTYHTLIDPGEIPLGYAFEAKQTIEEVHGLPYPPYEAGESDYLGILDKILTFLEPGKLPDGRYPPLYTIENNIKASESILASLSESGCYEREYFRVFLLPKMFFWLKNKCVEYLDEENVGFPVMSNAESEISKDVFCYAPGISCTFHMGSEEKYHNCSLSVVQRLVYVICDHCCQHLDVVLIPGKHCRLKSDTERNARAPSERGSRSKWPSAPPSEVGHDGRSSYVDDASTFDWRREHGGGSFLHDEIASNFSAFEVSSVTSRSSRGISTPAYSVVSRRNRRQRGRGEEEEEAEEEKEERRIPLGRGSSIFF